MMLHRTIVAGLLLATTTAAGRGDDAVLARGRYIVEVAAHCGGCHTPLDAAHRPIAALRQGRHRDGRPIGPPMPVDLYRRISDADIAAIVAYLRTVSAVAHLVTGRSRYDFAVVSCGGSAHVAPPADTPAARGAYLAGPLAHCIHCHTPTGPDERRDWARTGAGGVTFTGPWGAAVSANITSDRDTGIGSWSDVRIVGELTTGHDPDGRVLAPPMASNAIAWRQLTPRDRADLVAYLRTLPPQ
jgi:mono/diheme cytochrome c family protein